MNKMHISTYNVDISRLNTEDISVIHGGNRFKEYTKCHIAYSLSYLRYDSVLCHLFDFEIHHNNINININLHAHTCAFHCKLLFQNRTVETISNVCHVFVNGGYNPIQHFYCVNFVFKFCYISSLIFSRSKTAFQFNSPWKPPVFG